MIPKPKVISIPSPNYDGGRSGYKPVAIVLHIMEGLIGSASSWFRNPHSKVSAHFGIGKDGMIQQYVDEDDTAWANGLRWDGEKWYTYDAAGNPTVRTDPTAAVVQNRPGVNPNLYTISIEHEGRPGEVWTPAMLQKDIALIAYLCERYGITPDRDHIIGHNQIDPVNRAYCPSNSCPFDAIINGVRKMLEASRTQPDVDWHKEYVATLGVAQAHEGAMKYAITLLTRGSDDASSAEAMRIACKVLQLALAGQWVTDKNGKLIAPEKVQP